MLISVKPAKTLMGRLDHGCDLLDALTRICTEQNVSLGQIHAIGAVQKAVIGFYDQQTHEYQFEEINSPMEIAQLTGNVSLKDGNPFVHAHVTLTHENGEATGGHLAPGTIVFACEFVLEVFEGPQLAREFDETTGLTLWPAG